MKVETLEKLNYLALGLGVLVSIVAMAFYWTRYWIQFTPNAIPWLFYPLIPYAILGVIGYFINRKKKLKRTAVSLLVGSIVLLGLTAWFYIPLLDSSLIFYLRMVLGMSAIWLSAVAVIFVIITFLSSLGANNKFTPSNNAPQSDA